MEKMIHGSSMDIKQLYGALARGYCSEKNRSKELDSDLIVAMADEVMKIFCE